MKKVFLCVALLCLIGLSGCDQPLGDKLQFSVSCEDGLLYICTSIILDPAQQKEVTNALTRTPGGFGGMATIIVDPDKLWNVRTVSDLVKIIKENKGPIYND